MVNCDTRKRCPRCGEYPPNELPRLERAWRHERQALWRFLNELQWRVECLEHAEKQRTVPRIVPLAADAKEKDQP